MGQAKYHLRTNKKLLSETQPPGSPWVTGSDWQVNGEVGYTVNGGWESFMATTFVFSSTLFLSLTLPSIPVILWNLPNTSTSPLRCCL